VLIASVILAVGAAVTLSHLQALLDYSQRAQRHKQEVRELVNRSIVLGHQDLNAVDRRIRGEHLELDVPQERGGPAVVRVENRGQAGVQVDVSVGFAPVQVFTIPGEGRHQLRLLGPGLKPERPR
jgi:type II secretory pathway component PulJ